MLAYLVELVLFRETIVGLVEMSEMFVTLDLRPQQLRKAFHTIDLLSLCVCAY